MDKQTNRQEYGLIIILCIYLFCFFFIYYFICKSVDYCFISKIINEYLFMSKNMGDFLRKTIFKAEDAKFTVLLFKKNQQKFYIIIIYIIHYYNIYIRNRVGYKIREKKTDLKCYLHSYISNIFLFVLICLTIIMLYLKY